MYLLHVSAMDACALLGSTKQEVILSSCWESFSDG